MSTAILNFILTTTLNWLQEPQTILAIIGFLMSIPSLYKKYKDLKIQAILNDLKNIALNESKKLADQAFSNDAKREEVIRILYLAIPEKYKKYIPYTLLVEIVNGIYHTHVKNKG